MILIASLHLPAMMDIEGVRQMGRQRETRRDIVKGVHDEFWSVL